MYTRTMTRSVHERDVWSYLPPADTADDLGQVWLLRVCSTPTVARVRLCACIEHYAYKITYCKSSMYVHKQA